MYHTECTQMAFLQYCDQKNNAVFSKVLSHCLHLTCACRRCVFRWFLCRMFQGVQAFCRIEKCRINIWHFEFRVFSLLHFFTSFNFPLMLVCFQAKVHSCRFEILHRYCHSVWEYCKMNHLIFGLMQISSPGYYLTWIFPSGKNCHAVVIPGFKCDSVTNTK